MPYDDIYFARDKRVIAQYLNLDWCVDDSEENAQKISGVCDSYLLDRPWNAEAKGNFKRVMCLNDIIKE